MKNALNGDGKQFYPALYTIFGSKEFPEKYGLSSPFDTCPPFIIEKFICAYFDI